MAYVVLIAFIINFMLALVGILKIPRRYFFKNYFVNYALLTNIWLFCNLLIITRDSYFWLRVSYAVGAWMTASAVLMAISFSRQKRLEQDLLLKILGIGAFFSLLSVLPGVLFHSSFREPITEKTVNSVFTPYFFSYVIFLFVSILFVIRKMYVSMKEFEGIAKKQARSIFIGVLFFGSFSFLFSFLLPTFGFTDFIFMDTAGTLVFVGFVAYAIFRYRLMNIEFIIRRSTLYGILIIIITGVYLGSILVFEMLLQGILKFQSILTRLLAALAIALTFLPLRNRIENLINRLFFRTNYEYSRALKLFSEKLVTILDLRELMGAVVENIGQILRVGYVALLAFDKQQGRYKVKASIGFDDGIRSIEFNNRNRMISWLRERAGETHQIAVKQDFIENPGDHRTEILGAMKILKADLCIPLFFNEKLIGVLSISEKKSGEPYSSDDFRLLRTLSNQASIALANAFAYDELKKSYLETIEALAKAIEAKDEYTRGHSERVVKISMETAKTLNISREEIDLLKYAGILHDVGKIAINDGIIRKRATLDEQEWELMRTHPVAGEKIIAPISFLKGAGLVIRHHHERWDGRGYPDHLSGESIPLLSRIISIADTYDAITSARPYRPALSHDYAVEEIKRCSGSQFDPKVVDCFLSLCQEELNGF